MADIAELATGIVKGSNSREGSVDGRVGVRIGDNDNARADNVGFDTGCCR